jgi:sec-independent protein translocase protein TatA
MEHVVTVVNLAFIGVPGTQELVIIGIVCILLFGNRLPSVMRSLGEGMSEFKKAINKIGD